MVIYPPFLPTFYRLQMYKLFQSKIIKSVDKITFK